MPYRQGIRRPATHSAERTTRGHNWSRTPCHHPQRCLRAGLGGAWARDGCGRAITRAAEGAGIEAHITEHSGRRDLVSTGRKKGKRVEKLRKQGGWSPKSAVFWDYVDDGEKREDTATKGLGL